MVIKTIFFHSLVIEIIQESKALHRLCGQRGAYDSKRAKNILLFLYSKEKIRQLLILLLIFRKSNFNDVLFLKVCVNWRHYCCKFISTKCSKCRFLFRCPEDYKKIKPIGERSFFVKKATERKNKTANNTKNYKNENNFYISSGFDFLGDSLLLILAMEIVIALFLILL